MDSRLFIDYFHKWNMEITLDTICSRSVEAAGGASSAMNGLWDLVEGKEMMLCEKQTAFHTNRGKR